MIAGRSTLAPVLGATLPAIEAASGTGQFQISGGSLPPGALLNHTPRISPRRSDPRIMTPPYEVSSSCELSPGRVESPSAAPNTGPRSSLDAHYGGNLESLTEDHYGESANYTEPEPAEQEPAISSSFVKAAPYLPPYKLPRSPNELYKKQVDPVIWQKPANLVFATNKWQTNNKLLSEPFDRVLKKLNHRPSSEGPCSGPMSNPNEPVWFEMTHRLQGILQKQSRRAERRKKRRARSKQLRGRGKQAAANVGRNLREYLDRSFADYAKGGLSEPGEFIEKVQERNLMRPSPGVVEHSTSTGQQFSATKIVRPVYIPPPPKVRSAV